MLEAILPLSPTFKKGVDLMHGFRRWGLSVLTMVAVVTAVLFLTGWGSAIASSVSTGVIVKNPPSNPVNVHDGGTVTVAGSVALAGTPSVSVSNPPAAPTTDVIASGTHDMPGGPPFTGFTFISPSTDLSAYRSLTLYVGFGNAQSSPTVVCYISTYDPAGDQYPLGQVDNGNVQNDHVMTFDPAPPDLDISCSNDDIHTQTVQLMLTGRTG